MANPETINKNQMIMKKIFIVLVLTSFVISCKNSKTTSHWSKADVDAFTTNCVNGASANMGADKAKSYCDCMLGKIESKYPKADDAGKMEMNAMTEMAKDCIK